MASTTGLSEDLLYLLAAFAPAEDAAAKSKALLILSSYCQGVRSTSANPETATKKLHRIFLPHIESRLQDTELNAQLCGITFFEALFEVDPDAASAIFQHDGIAELVADIADLGPPADLSISLCHLLGYAFSHKQCHPLVSPDVIAWLKAESLKDAHSIRAAASVALLKYAKGHAPDAQVQPSQNPSALVQEVPLAKSLVDLILSEEAPLLASSVGDAVEGLAYLSINPEVKELLSHNSKFLETLFSLGPQHKSPLHTTLYFGILMVVANICAFPPQLSEEQSQIRKLKRMANQPGGSSSSEGTSQLDQPPAVRARIQRLISAGILEILSPSASESSSVGNKIATSKILFSIVEDVSNRGTVLQGGGAKTLGTIIGQLLNSESTMDGALEAIQALAKLTITSSPIQVFGPAEGRMLDAIRPFSFMVQHPSSTLLQQFEGMMALTNLASHSPEVADRVARAEGLLSCVELLLLGDNVLVRRASMELICNLIAGSEDVFGRYGLEGGGRGSSKLHLLVAMSDVDDIPTRLAASGALATITSSPQASQLLLTLQKDRHSPLAIISRLITPEADDPGDPGLVHRGLTVVQNLTLIPPEQRGPLISEAKQTGLVKALEAATERRLDANLQGLAAECLSFFVQ